MTAPDREAARAAIEARVARAAERHHVPGIAWGVMLGGRLAMSGGTGVLHVETGTAPDASSPFRIASMTKSFTAAAVLSLRDAGRLRLDDTIGSIAPELAAITPPTTDSPPLTVRHLLSMSSGLPSDDEWADRQLDMDAAALTAVAATGVGFASAPGTAYEYSNLGYAFLGRIVERAAGTTVQDLVTERFLRPLGMTATRWTRPPDPWARPYAWFEGQWHDEREPLGDGVMAPMGGLWSTVADIVRWMAFFDDAFPPRDDPDDGPLARASRREQQQAQRAQPSVLHRARGSGLDAVPARLEAGGYGFGLESLHDLRFGHLVGHAGGLPGYGSHMRWLSGRGVGAAAFGNVTYAPMYALTQTILEVLDDHGLVPTPEAPPSEALLRAAERLVALLAAWDSETARALFTDNVLLDRDEKRRRADAARLGTGLRLRTVEAETMRSGHAIIDRDDGKEIRVELHLSPHAVPRVQWYEVVRR